MSDPIKINNIYLNDKRIAFPYDYSVEEGWVEILDTQYFADMASLSLASDIKEDENLEPIDPQTKRVFGKVEVR